MVLGNFNAILSPQECHTSVPIPSREFWDLATYYDALGLFDLPSIGLYFTWTNNLVWSKLDRAIVDHA